MDSTGRSWKGISKREEFVRVGTCYDADSVLNTAIGPVFDSVIYETISARWEIIESIRVCP